MSLDRHRFRLVSYYLSLVAVGLIVGTQGPALADLARQTSTDLQGVSLILVMRPLGYLCGALACGRWLDRQSGHPVLAVAALACAILLALVPLAPRLGILAWLILGLGFAHSLLDVGSNILLAWVCGKRLGPYLSGMHFSFGVGAFVGPMLVAWSLAHTGSSGHAFWALSLFLLPLAIWFSLVPRPAHPSVDDAPALVWDKGLAALLVGCFFLYGGTESGFGAWIYQFALTRRLADPAQAAGVTSLFWGLLGLGRLAGIVILPRLSAQRFLIILVPGALLSVAALLFLPPSPVTLWAASAGMGLCMACIFPTLLVCASQRLAHGGRISGRLTSFMFVGSSAGGMVLPWLMGQLFEPKGPRWAMGLALLSLAGLAGMIGWVARWKDSQWVSTQ
jgi:fucose permease